MKEYERANIFSKEKFDKIEETEIEIAVIGEIELTEEEKSVLKKHPKFALLDNLTMEKLELEFELGFGKYRYQIQREIKERKEKEKEMGESEIMREEKTPEEKEEAEAKEAELRQVFDPINRVYDPTKLRVTDLQINTRVTLPKGLPSHHEAWLEVRRTKYEEVTRQYLDKNNLPSE